MEETSTGDGWLDRFFASYYRHRPVNATFVGERGYDHVLPDFSENGVGDLESDGRALLGHGEGNAADDDSPSRPSDALALDRKLARGFLEQQRWEYSSGHFHRGNPSFHTGEAVFGVMGLFLARSLPAVQRVEAATHRMEAIPAFLSVARDTVQNAPSEWTQRAIRECDGAIAFFKDGWRALPELNGSDAAAFERAAAQAARAFSEHRTYLAAATPSSRSAYGAGEEALGLYLTSGHFLAQSADEIARYARAEMAQAQADLRAGAAALGTPDPEEALTALQALHPPVEGYYARYAELWAKTREVAEANDLVTWPDFPLEYVPRPEWARAAAPSLYFLFYRSPPAVNRAAVHKYLVTPVERSMDSALQDQLLRANNDSVIKANHVLHHGSIGHHVQNWNAFRAESRIGRMAAVDCGSRIAMFCGLTMAEGWACYATDLMAEFGMLTPLEKLAETKSRMRMAARAIVDIELHTGRMTLEEAAAFYQREAGMSEAAALGEAVKNSMFPGGALIYLIGSDSIRDLRRDLERALGSNFSLRGFHDKFLSYGSIPVSLVAAAMRRSAGQEV